MDKALVADAARADGRSGVVSESVQTLEAARGLWQRVSESGEPDASSAARGDHVLSLVEAGLRKWVGAEGYAALLNRAIALTAPEHPALSAVDDLGIARSPSSNGRVYTPTEVQEGLIALLATLMALLGRIIGESMAMRLIEQIGAPSPRGTVSSNIQDVSHE